MDAMAEVYEAGSWDEGEDYWSTPAEMFAEGRARCLGYGADTDFAEMSCDDIDSLIAGTEMADQIIRMSKSGFWVAKTWITSSQWALAIHFYMQREAKLGLKVNQLGHRE